TDASSVDVSAGFHFTFDCGDGNGLSSPGASANATCVAPPDLGDITVRGQIIDKDGGTQTYSKVIHVTQPVISLTPANNNLGGVDAGGGRRSKVFTVTNVGTAPLTVSNTQLSGTDPSQFSIVNTACSGPPVKVSGTCTITVAFAPKSGGQKSATLV